MEHGNPDVRHILLARQAVRSAVIVVSPPSVGQHLRLWHT